MFVGHETRLLDNEFLLIKMFWHLYFEQLNFYYVPYFHGYTVYVRVGNVLQ